MELSEEDAKNREQAVSELCRNTLVILMKHNLVKVWQSEIELITFYQFNEVECLLRLSIPRYTAYYFTTSHRYLTQTRRLFSALHLQVLETIVIHVSLMKSEIEAIVD